MRSFWARLRWNGYLPFLVKVEKLAKTFIGYEFSMRLIHHVVLIFFSFFSILWFAVIEKSNFLEGKSAIIANTVLGLGSCFSTLFFCLRELWHKQKMKKITLQNIKERLSHDMVLISHQERVILGSSMNYFVKQPGRIANANNNIEGLSKYKLTKKMKRMFEKI